MRIVMTLCIIHIPPRVLLGMKKRGFGAGRWNGFGGKVGPDETIEDAVRRETKEEAGLLVCDIAKRGVLEFQFQDTENIVEMHIFNSTEFEGTPKESEEMRPEWFALDKIPYEVMWPGDRHWIPLFLAGKKFKGDFYFKDINTLLDYKLTEVEII